MSSLIELRRAYDDPEATPELREALLARIEEKQREYDAFRAGRGDASAAEAPRDTTTPKERKTRIAAIGLTLVAVGIVILVVGSTDSLWAKIGFGVAFVGVVTAMAPFVPDDADTSGGSGSD